MNTAFVSVPFLYRHFYLCRATPSDTHLILGLSITPILFGIGCGVAFFNNWEQTELDDLALSTLYHAGWRFKDGPTHVFHGYLTNPSTAVAIGLCTLSLGAVYVIILWTECKVLRSLKFHGRGMRLSTRKMHADINRALIALALCPLLSTLIPLGVSLTCFFFRVDIGMLAPLLTVINTSVAVFNPITTCVFVRPYRRMLSRMFGRKSDIPTTTVS